jgi:hypothetical protein
MMNLTSRHAIVPAGYMLKFVALELELVNRWLLTFASRSNVGVRWARVMVHQTVEYVDKTADQFIKYPRGSK